MNEDDDLMEERIDGLDRLARTRAPSRDLWPGIQARLARRRRSRYGWGPFARAASLGAGLAAVFTLALGPAGTGARPGAIEAAALPLPTHSRAIVEAHLSIVRQAERELRRALEDDPGSATLRSLIASTENRQRELTALL